MNAFNFTEPVKHYARSNGTPAVYGLVDPVTRQVRYVGSSVNIQKRYYGHLHSTRGKPRTLKDRWICDLKLARSIPLCVILEEFPIGKDRQARHQVESSWIEKLHQKGEADLNMQMHPAVNGISARLRAENRNLHLRVKELEAKVRYYKGLGYDLL